MLEEVSKDNRKALVRAASELYKSGAEPSAPPTPEQHFTRAQRRQGMRAMGFRGSKAGRHNFRRQLPLIQQVVLADEALAAAKDRAEHPVRSRLRRR